MKILILVRHAKSDWGNPGLDDFDRPLNERGKKDAPVMAKRLKDKKVKVDAVIASPAKRAAKTAKIFAEEMDVNKDDFILKDELYMAGEDSFFKVIESINNKFSSVAIFSHNNGITDFANLLTDARIDNIPTCGVFAIKIVSDSWKDFRKAKKEFWFFDYPKATV
jgi:phosphohistidine phosphatase